MSHEPSRAAKARYRGSFGMARFPIGTESEFVYCKISQATAQLTTENVALIEHCNRFATLDEHADRLSLDLRLSAQQRELVRERLESLLPTGLLLSPQSLLDKVADASDLQAEDGRISAVGIPTKDRPEQLKRTLTSFASCSRQYGRDIEFFVADQSSQEETRNTNRQSLTEIKSATGCPVTYLGPSEKAALAQRLADMTAYPLDWIRFAVLNDENCPKAYGANRNTLLLATTGRMLLQADDDATCEMASSPVSDDRLTLTSAYSRMQLRFLDGEQIATINNTFAPADIFARHEELLGKSISRCIESRNWTALDLDSAQAGFFKRPAPHKVSVTALGLTGDPGIGTSFFNLLLDGDERTSLIRSGDVYQQAMAGMDLLQFVPGATISDGAWCNGLSIGLDNRGLLPPFVPVQRNEDGIFATLLQITGAGYIGFLPYMLRHTRHAEKELTPGEAKQFISKISCGALLRLLVHHLAQGMPAEGPARRLKKLGQILVDLGNAKSSNFEHVLRMRASANAVYYLERLDTMLKKYNRKPDFWAKDVKECQSELQAAVQRRNYFVPHDLAASVGEEEALLLLQRIVLKFGRVMQIWPDLTEAMMQCRKQGRPIGEQL